MPATNLKGLSLDELGEFIVAAGEKPYRARQIFKWLYSQGVQSFEDMTNLSKELRSRLAHEASISCLELERSRCSNKDNTVKFLFRLPDRHFIEAVLMFDRSRTTLCISTQAGCAIDCKFCATGLMGLQRHLTPGEIFDQLLLAEKATQQKVTNIVCMGMGEPFHNYDNVIAACDLFCHDLGPNMARRHIVISTSGLIPQIIRFADEGHKYRLAVSLNATTDAVRSKLMPLNRKWPLAELIQAALYYTEKSGERVTFEYVLMDGINDTVADASRLLAMLKGLRCKVNLIPYNATEGQYRRPSRSRIAQFYEAMSPLKAPVTIRWSKGDDIEAGCGQLAGKEHIGSMKD